MRRIILAVLVLAGLTGEAHAQSAVAIGANQQTDAAVPYSSQTTTGTAGASFTTVAVPCLFAHGIIWRVSSTTAKRCSVAVVEVSDDSTTWITASIGASTIVDLWNGAFLLSAFTNNAFGSGKSVVDLSTNIITDGASYAVPVIFPWRYIHAKFTFGYTGNYATLAAFTVTPIVVRDAEHSSIWRDFY